MRLGSQNMQDGRQLSVSLHKWIIKVTNNLQRPNSYKQVIVYQKVEQNIAEQNRIEQVV